MSTNACVEPRMVQIGELIRGLPVALTQGSLTGSISAIVEDSRRADRGSLFVARHGTKTDGRAFITDAVSRGAIAVLTDQPQSLPRHVAALACDNPAAIGARLAERFYGNPSQELKLIGITGTNGKTTTAYLIQQLLNHAGMRCGLIGTVEIDDGATRSSAELTTPPAIDLSRLLRSMVDNGCRACVMEASSHALHQRRTAGLNFHIGVFTNLTGDHLDYHQTMDEYLAAKALLFESLPADGCSVLNIDDPASNVLAARTASRVLACSQTNTHSECWAKIRFDSLDHTEVVLGGPWGIFDCRLPLIGRHNVSNALQALAVGFLLGMDRTSLSHSISTCKAPPGRLEPVTRAGEGFAVLVDYAHTDDALENVLRALRPLVGRNGSGGQLRVVFGCGGDRDKTKRPRMAAVACRYADHVIITSDNPRTEDPNTIIQEIRAGIDASQSTRVQCITDRAAAIDSAIDRVGPGDIVLIAGKGHEDYQIIGSTKRPFDDRKVAAQALAQGPARTGATGSP